MTASFPSNPPGSVSEAVNRQAALWSLSETPAPGNQLEQQHDHREHYQGVNEAATDAKAKPERPQDE